MNDQVNGSTEHPSGERVESLELQAQGLVWSWQFDPLDADHGVEIAYGGKACAIAPSLNNAQLLVERLNGYQEMIAASEILELAKRWGRAKAEVFRFGREEYAHKMSALYQQEHHLSPDDAASLHAQIRGQMDELNDVEHKAEWALYEKLQEAHNAPKRETETRQG